jgi:tetratricopeptide (TPR) repeat protein
MSIRRSLLVGGFITFALLAAAGAVAQDLATSMQQKRYGEVRQLALQRIAKAPNDEQAYRYLALASMQLTQDVDELERLAATIKPCLEIIPQSALCHLTMGEVYGNIALLGGMLKGMRYASSIKTEFQKAVALDPKHFAARYSLNQFYLEAPSVIGGGLAKAETNTQEFEALRPGDATLLRADIYIHSDQFDRASTLLLAAKPYADPDVADAQLELLVSLGFRLMNAKHADKAVPIFEFARNRYPDDATVQLGYGRSQLETGQVDKAIESLRTAVALDPRRGAQYRLGVAQQTKGDKDEAVKSFRAYLALPAASKNDEAVSDAKKRLDELVRK